MPQKTYSAPAAASTLEVLEFMAANPGARGPSELAKRLGLTPNLTFRVLNVLQEKGYVKRNPAGQYELTSGLFSLGMRLHNNFDLRKQSRPFLEALAEESGESCQLQEFEGDHMLQLDFVPPPADYYLAVTPGIRLHLHGIFCLKHPHAGTFAENFRHETFMIRRKNRWFRSMYRQKQSWLIRRRIF